MKLPFTQLFRSRRRYSLQMLAVLGLLPVLLALGGALLFSKASLDEVERSVANNLQLAAKADNRLQQVLLHQLPMELYLNELSSLITRFRSEFELLVLDPDRDDSAIIALHREMQQNYDRLPGSTPHLPEALKLHLMESSGIALELLEELLETSGSNDRQRLFRNSFIPLDDVFVSIEEINSQQIQINQDAQAALQQASLRSQNALSELRLKILRTEQLLLGVVVMILLVNLICWGAMGRVLRSRLALLAEFSQQVVAGDARRPPFSSTDSTGRLAVTLAQMGQRIRALLKEASHQAEMAEQARAEAEALAFYDPLTGLENRRSFNQRLDRAIALVHRGSARYALMYLDLDNFKHINDSLGHDVGDQLLIETARRLQQCIRQSDSLARLGGDEFGMIVQSASSGCSMMAERILQKLSVPLQIAEQSLIISCSIGIAYVRIDGDDATTLQKHADLALYKAKAMGRNNYQFFSPELHALALHRMRLLSELRQTLSEGGFCLHYQPKYCLESGEIRGLEALIRWPHPTEGMVSPAQFIPLAEETGLISELGNWVLRQACRDIRRMSAGKVALPVAVNLSGRQFYDGKLVDTVQLILREYGVDPCLLELEVTETVLIDDIDASINLLQGLRDLGVSIAIDDFGMGFSSLNYLKRLPIDVLKIDRNFVMHVADDSKDRAIVNTIVELAHRLDLKVVAEGIETLEQQAYLSRIGCDIGQGYLLARPDALDCLSLNSPVEIQ
ncbi:putative bifunctional diguanylate cyclase/phosphodiesterase [Marinobacterium jannaschii]|uniref:putative bifunctional diguanylate cyclase/phosphodiesterase n=1 Tax=Marinobacterium jannaschii TaxID=64970 RepID=UPI00068644B2|nr:EAL domain-containing protein [Marinobacterium jannaschii]